MAGDQRWVGFEEQPNRYERGGALAETFRGRPETFRFFFTNLTSHLKRPTNATSMPIWKGGDLAETFR